MVRSVAVFVVVASSLAFGSRMPSAAPGQAASRPTSYQLIDRALAAKRIDAESAHKYRVFAAFGDSRLPAEYRGADGAFESPPEVEKVAELLETFSAQTRSELAPFFMRPDESGSWITLATVSGQEPSPGGAPPDDAPPDGSEGLSLGVALGVDGQTRSPIVWKSRSAAGGKARVWWQERYAPAGDEAKAEVLASELTRIIWDKLVNLMGPEPISDATRPPNGGDGAFDFYLVHAPMAVDPTGRPARSFLGRLDAPAGRNPCNSPGYILLDSNAPIGSPTSPGILSTAAHEFMHAITRAFRPRDNGGCGERWINEASGVWAENYVYPKANAEHTWLDVFMKHPRWSIDEWKEDRNYGAYLLPYFMEKAGGGAQFMPAIWEKMRSKKSLDAINDVMPNGWDKWWPLFLNTTYNQTPVDQPDGYRAWDGITKNPPGWHINPLDIDPGPVTMPLTFDSDAQASGPPGLPYLTGAYFEFKLTPRVRSLYFDNNVVGMPHASVWGIQKIRGTWKKAEDWSKERDKSWCRDESKEDIEELVIVFGNSDWQTQRLLNPREPPTIKAYPTGCTAWTGTTTTTNTISIADPNLTIREVVTSSMRFMVDSSLIRSGKPVQYWRVQSGTLNWRASVTGSCTGETQGNLVIRDLGPGNEVANLNIWEEDRKMRVSGNQGPWPGDIPKYKITCPQSPVTEVDWMLHSTFGWFNTDEGTQLAADGKSFGGDFTSRIEAAGIVTRWQYSFRVSP